MNKPAFPIVFATDAGYAKYLSTAIYSLLKNNSSSLRIIILTSGISKQDEHKLQNICLKFKTSLKITLIDDRCLDNLKTGFHFNKSNYFKLFTADFIHDDKCLYLDSDIIVNDSIFEIINIELGDTYLAAVEEKNLKRNAELGMNINSKYFNVGVMLINLNKWRSRDIKSRVVSFVEKNPTRILWADQCGLNAVIDGDFVNLDSRYNFMNKLPSIVHYAGSSKPWDLNNNHPFKKLWQHYHDRMCDKNRILVFLMTVRYYFCFVISFVKKKFLEK